MTAASMGPKSRHGFRFTVGMGGGARPGEKPRRRPRPRQSAVIGSTGAREFRPASGSGQEPPRPSAGAERAPGPPRNGDPGVDAPDGTLRGHFEILPAALATDEHELPTPGNRSWSSSQGPQPGPRKQVDVQVLRPRASAVLLPAPGRSSRRARPPRPPGRPKDSTPRRALAWSSGMGGAAPVLFQGSEGIGDRLPSGLCAPYPPADAGRVGPGQAGELSRGAHDRPMPFRIAASSCLSSVPRASARRSSPSGA